MAELEPIGPAEAKEMYLAQRRGEVAESTLQGHHYRLKPFVQWCESTGLTNLNDLTARSLHEYRLHRKERDDSCKVTRTQLSTIRVFVKFLESIDGVGQRLHDKMLIPSMEVWCRGAEQLIDECFRASGRMRPKWDEIHYSNGGTYGERLIYKVSRGSTFDGDYL